jgi:hypothetical protein
MLRGTGAEVGESVVESVLVIMRMLLMGIVGKTVKTEPSSFLRTQEPMDHRVMGPSFRWGDVVAGSDGSVVVSSDDLRPNATTPIVSSRICRSSQTE